MEALPAVEDAEPEDVVEGTEAVDASTAETGAPVDEPIAAADDTIPAAEPHVDAEPAVEAEPHVEAEPAVEAEPPVQVEPPVVVEPPAVVEVVEQAESSPDAEGEPASIDEIAPTPAASADSDPEVVESTGADALRIRGLVKHFGENRAVNNIDLTVPAGSFYGIVGPNGAGKTTTLSIVAGLLRADEGSVAICGIDQKSQPNAAKRVMGVLPDRLRTFDRLTGRQLLYYYGLLRGLASSVIEKRTADLARAFDLGDALSRVVSDYSAGMTKKIMLAGAMIHSPRVLVLDEPFESVDPVSSAVILEILRAYVAHGGTVILSSHGMDLVERVCSRVAIIVGGEVLAEGTIDEVRAGQTLEARFVELSGGIGEVEGLEWLHMFSD